MPAEVKPAYMGEALLLRWGDTASSGRTVTLQISEDDPTHPFKGFKCGQNGQRMEIVCVLKNDDESPISPDHARRSVATKPAPNSAGQSGVQNRVPEKSEPAAPVVKAETKRTPSQIAALKIQDAAFVDWLVKQYPAEYDNAKRYAPDDWENYLLKMVVGIVSKKELDVPDSIAAERWRRLLASYDYRNQVRA